MLIRFVVQNFLSIGDELVNRVYAHIGAMV